MRARVLAALLLTLAFLGAVPAARAETTASDPKAVRIADQVMKGLGGEKAWNDLEGLRWSFGSSMNDTVRGVPRRHAWNKHTGMHRVDGVTRAGDKFTFIHHVGDSTGKAWMNGVPIEGDSLKKLIARAQSLWINDTYWMLMPYKLRDPGVTLQLAGEAKDGDTTWDKLALSFDHVGQTPGDRYWVFVNRANHRVEKWEMVLQGDQPPPVAYTWESWEEHGGLWFPTAHRQDKLNVFTNAVETVSAFPPGTFEQP